MTKAKTKPSAFNRNKMYFSLTCSLLLCLGLTEAKAASHTVGASGCDFTTIQAAIDDGGTSDGDTIVISDTVHTEAGINITKSLTITGSGSSTTTLQAHANAGSASSRVFSIASGKTVTIEDMTIRHGYMDGEHGGAINNSGTLTVNRCTISDSETRTGMSGGRGGGIYNGGTFSANQCVFSGNTCQHSGGGFCNASGKTATLTNCTIANNTSSDIAAGIISWGGSLTLQQCTISGNSGSYVGGVHLIGAASAINCTISGNSANTAAGGVLCESSTATITNCTITANSCTNHTGGIRSWNCTTTIKNTIVAGNTNGGGTGDLQVTSGAFTTSGYNLIRDNTGLSGTFPAGTPNGNNDWAGTSASPVEPLLNALAANGGYTQTHSLQATSPAIDKIPNGVNGMGTSPLNVDQRGTTRPQNTNGDIGSYEYVTPAAPTVTTTAASGVTSSGASSGGNVTTDGGSSVTARGVCWNTTGNPTTADSKTSDGTGTGSFTSTISGLTRSTLYYVRAYATNSTGTGYGNQLSFTSSAQIPTVSAVGITNIEQTTATSGGTVTDDGGGTITARGLCWSTTTAPTVADSKTTESGTAGAFSSTMTGLTMGTTYYVRAYATNSAGTGYAGELSFLAGSSNDDGNSSTDDSGDETPVEETDSDGDGTPDDADGCPADSAKTSPGVCGCGTADTDSDGDGTADCADACPNDPTKTNPGATGCGTVEEDTDGDGVPDGADGCPNDPQKTEPGVLGCGVSEEDTDGDGTPDSVDGCPNDPLKTEPGLAGCGVFETDTDGDGAPDNVDGCPLNPNKIEPGVEGCNVTEDDTDGDGTPDSADDCPTDPNKVTPGLAGCGKSELDSDGDGTPDAVDKCPDDPNKVTLGDGGCGTIEPDSDGDGVPDSVDVCPNDPNKTTPGMFGCGASESDTDGDGTPDDLDGCPNDPNKNAPGEAGCGNSEPDTDGDGTPDSVDGCSSDPHKTAPGNLGCGVTENPNLNVTVEVEGEHTSAGDNHAAPTAPVGGQFNVQVNIHNIGNGGATHVRVAVQIPANTEFISAAFETVETGAPLPLEYVVEGDTVYLYVGDVSASQQLAVVMTLRAIEAGDVTFDPQVGSNEMSDTVSADQSVEAVIDEENYSWIITTTPVPCGVLGLAPLAMTLGVMFGWRTRRGR